MTLILDDNVRKIVLYNNNPLKAIVNAASNFTYVETDDTGRH
jgi:hypothetical protein